MRITKILAVGLLALAGAADATVYYSFVSQSGAQIRSFTYSSATFIDHGIFTSDELNSCDVVVSPPAHCTSVEFSGGTMDTILFTTAPTAARGSSPLSTTKSFLFAGDAFDKAGDYWSSDGSAMLNVTESPAPEPASWMMMISGFGLIGVASRRRRPALRPA